MATDGKYLESVLEKEVKDVLRLYDTRTASSGFVPAQPADFVVPKLFIEVKDTELGDHFLKSNFSKKQIALQAYWEARGVKSFYFLNFRSFKKKVFVPAKVIRDFMKKRGKGKLFYSDVEPHVVNKEDIL